MGTAQRMGTAQPRKPVVRVGTSGWRYPAWRGDFYPPGLAQRRELGYLAERFSTVEINGSFYSLQRPTSYRRWAAETPSTFRFAVKGGRYLTHLKRLRDCRDPLANFFASGVLLLAERLGPILWQLPERVGYEHDVLDGFCRMLPRTQDAAAELAATHTEKVTQVEIPTSPAPTPIRYAIEARHPSFAEPACVRHLRDLGVAMVAADTAGRWPMIMEPTADFVYARLHGSTELYTSGYSDAELSLWADRLRDLSGRSGGGDVYVYFDNDAHGHAPFDARRMAALLG